MKKIIMLLAVIVTGLASFAQKSKAIDTTKAGATIVTQYACPMHPDVVSDKPGKCSKCNMDLTSSKKEQMKRKVTATYSCPMHQEMVSDHAGKCAKCSSALVVDRRGSKHGTTVYSCSMHPEVASNETGKCPVCGMALEKPKTKKPAKS